MKTERQEGTILTYFKIPGLLASNVESVWTGFIIFCVSSTP